MKQQLASQIKWQHLRKFIKRPKDAAEQRCQLRACHQMSNVWEVSEERGKPAGYKRPRLGLNMIQWTLDKVWQNIHLSKSCHLASLSWNKSFRYMHGNDLLTYCMNSPVLLIFNNAHACIYIWTIYPIPSACRLYDRWWRKCLSFIL